MFIRIGGIGGEWKSPKSIEEREWSRRVRRAIDWLERGEDVIDALRLWNWKNRATKTDGFGRKNLQIGDEYKIASHGLIIVYGSITPICEKDKESLLLKGEKERF